MTMNLESTIVVAAAEGGLVMAIILIISVISWIVNLIQGNTPQQQKAKNTPRQRPKAEELEQYLQATKSAEERERERERKRSQQSKASNDRRQNKSKQQQQQRPAPAQQQQRSKSDRPGTRLAETHLAPTALGQGGRSLLDAQKVDAEVKQDVTSAVQRDITDAVQRDIGADGTKVAKQASTVHPLIKALRDPQGVRQAILLNEILNRPKSLR